MFVFVLVGLLAVINSKGPITQLRLTCWHPFVLEQLAFIGWCSPYHAGHLCSPRTFSLESHLNCPPGIRGSPHYHSTKWSPWAAGQQASTLEPRRPGSLSYTSSIHLYQDATVRHHCFRSIFWCCPRYGTSGTSHAITVYQFIQHCFHQNIISLCVLTIFILMNHNLFE